ncbi:DUF5592 family protein [uncultured Gemella sp.]|uniref:DUF5592 family protein n=1 Tax=uncultured Gemella sp. TaxID=254352 RepID=UPI0037DCF736
MYSLTPGLATFANSNILHLSFVVKIYIFYCVIMIITFPKTKINSKLKIFYFLTIAINSQRKAPLFYTGSYLGNIFLLFPFFLA